MRIAIVGAGLAGLACAHELERLGHAPDIFESRDRVGEHGAATETMARFMQLEPGQDLLEHLRQDLGLPVSPTAAIRRMVLHGPTAEAAVEGLLGYTTLRGPDERALDQQLLRHIASPVRYRSEPDVMELRHEYDWVVVANGNPHWPREFLQWRDDLTWWMRGAHVHGRFSPGELHLFFNTHYAGTGYGIIAPLDEHSATVGVAVPQSHIEEMEHYWEVFRGELGHFWHEEESHFQMDGYAVGLVRAHRLGNVLMVGAAGGFLEPMAMSGQVAALESGVMAARQMVLGDRSLERYARRWKIFYERALRVRRSVNTWTNEDMDRLVRMAAMGPGNMPASSLWNLDLLRFASE